MKKRSRRFRNWLVWWLQQKRKERNATTSFPSYILSALSYLVGDSSSGELVDSIGTTNPPAGYDYKAQSFLFDRSAKLSHTPITLSGAWEIEYFIKFSVLYGSQMILYKDANNVIMHLSDGKIRYYFGGTAYSHTVGGCVVGQIYKIILVRSGTSATLTQENIGTGAIVTETIAVSSADLEDQQLIYATPIAGNMWGVSIESDGDSLYLPCTNAVGTSIPMLINGSVAYGTLTGATLPDFYASSQDGVTGFNQNLLGFSQRENYIIYSEPTQDSETAARSEITYEAASGEMAAYVSNVVRVGDSSANRYCYVAGDDFYPDGTFEFYIQMDDGGVPVVPDDFTIQCGPGSQALTATPELVSGTVYKIAIETSTGGGSNWFGVYKATTKTDRGFVASGFQLMYTSDPSEYIKTAGSLISGIQPADPTDSSLDITGNALQYPGPIKKSAELTGYTGTWDGTAYGVTDLATSTAGSDHTIEIAIQTTDQDSVLFSTGGSASGNTWVAIPGGYAKTHVYTTTTNNNVTGTAVAVDDGELHIIKSVVSGGGSILSLYVDDILEDSTSITGSLTASTSKSVIAALSNTVGSYEFTGVIPYVKLYNSSDTLIHHWVCESSSTSEQPVIYDVVGSNHATLTSATLPFFTTESQEATYLLENGWELSSGNYIPAKAAGGESAAGNALTASPGDLRTIEPGFFEMPQDKGLIAADIVGQTPNAAIEFFFQSDGTQEEITYADLSASPFVDGTVNDQYFFSATKGLVIYDEPQDADDVIQIEDYMEIT